MKDFLEAAVSVWNPVGAVRRRLQDNTLSFPAVLPSAVAAMIACKLVEFAALRFFVNSMMHGLGRAESLPEFSEFVVKFGTAVGAIVPVAALLLIPQSVFRPYGRSAVAAAILLLIAAITFYTAAFTVTGYFVAGAQAWSNPLQGRHTFESLMWPLIILDVVLLVVFWGRMGLSQLQLSGPRFAGITLTAFGALCLLVLGIGFMAGEAG